MATRRNLVLSASEDFRPPLLKSNTSKWNRLENWLRRGLDLQAGSIWRDLKIELAQTDGRLLDIGCGAQVYRGLIPAKVAYHGLDTSDAKAHFGYEVPDTRYFDGDDWGVENNAFDTVLCTEVLEHIADPVAFLNRTCACLRPAGRLVLTVPFAARWHFVAHDYWRYTPSCLYRLLTSAGFNEIRVNARGNPLTVACYKAMAIHLMLLSGSGSTLQSVVMRALGVLLLPLLAVLTCVANLSLRADWGDDCLGYTVTAQRTAPSSHAERKESR